MSWLRFLTPTRKQQRTQGAGASSAGDALGNGHGSKWRYTKFK
jgi:hypothetical protein